jgi:hypothetical protein
MRRLPIGSVVLAVGLWVLAGCASPADAQEMAPPGGEYKQVSTLVPLPDYLPGLGTLYVQPKTLPYGPFLAYNKAGHLVSTIYMVPIKDIDAHKKIEDLGVADLKPLRVEMYYNAGHPGVPEPHYHVILWYVPEDQEPK